MAHGFATPTDLRTERNLLGSIASAIGSRIGKSSTMARNERGYASKMAEQGGTSLEEAGVGKGYFFKKALGSSFGGDRIARTRGRFESDPGPGRDPTGSQASRFRGGFDYNVTNEIFGNSEGGGGGALSAIIGGGLAGTGASVAQKLLESGSEAINPEVLGGEVAKYKGTKTNAAGFSVDTTATEIKDIAGILNQIGQMMVRTNSSTVQAIDNVQRINVKVVDSVQSLGQLQIGIAERQLQQQLLLATNAENTQTAIAEKQLVAAEKDRMARQRISSGNETPEGSGFEGPQGGILGNMLGGMGNLLDTGMSLLGGGRRGRGFGRRGRGLSRMSRAGRRAQRASGLSTANAGGPGIRGMNFRNNSMTGGKLSTNRILAGTADVTDSLGTAQNDITKRYAKKYGEKAAIKRFGAGGLEAAGMSLTKGARVAKFLSPVLKRVPLVGGLLDFGVSLALGEPIGRAAAKAIGATLGGTLGTLVPIPGVGTILGGIAGDMLGGFVYDALSGAGGSSSMPSGADGMVTTGPKSGYLAQLHGTEVTLSGNKSKEMEAISYNIGEGILEAQKRNKSTYAKLQADGLSQYYDKQNGWQKFMKTLSTFIPQFKFKWPWQDDDADDDGGTDDRDRPIDRIVRENYAFGHNLPATGTGRASLAAAQQYGASRDGGSRKHAGQDFDIAGDDATFESQIGGEVIGVYRQNGGYGRYVDIYNKDLDVTERIAEGAEILVKKGDKVTPGTPVAKGETSTGVIHYEIRDGKSGPEGTFEGTQDPMKFLREHTKHNNGVPKNISKPDPVGGGFDTLLQNLERSPAETSSNDLFGASSETAASTRALETNNPFMLMLMENASKGTSQAAVTQQPISLASSGSAAMGTDSFTRLGLLAGNP